LDLEQLLRKRLDLFLRAVLPEVPRAGVTRRKEQGTLNAGQAWIIGD